MTIISSERYSPFFVIPLCVAMFNNQDDEIFLCCMCVVAGEHCE